MASDITERWKASAWWRQLCLPLLPFTHARSESINADSLNSNFLQLGWRSGGRPQRAVHAHAVTCQHCDTHYFSRPRTLNLLVVGPTRYQLCHRANRTNLQRISREYEWLSRHDVYSGHIVICYTAWGVLLQVLWKVWESCWKTMMLQSDRRVPSVSMSCHVSNIHHSLMHLYSLIIS